MTLEEIEKLCDEATPGPWILTGDVHYYELSAPNGDCICQDMAYYPTAPCFADATFIAASRVLMPKLLAVAKAASDEAVLWSDAYCNHSQANQRAEAIDRLHFALSQLDSCPHGSS